MRAVLVYRLREKDAWRKQQSGYDWDDVDDNDDNETDYMSSNIQFFI